MIFLETSSLVAILAEEQEADDFATRLSTAVAPITGAHVLVEAAMVMSARRNVPPSVALGSIDQLIDQANLQVVPITRAIASTAVDAFARYGKGRSHPAQLNFGDCLSYGCAKVHSVPMLFKGSDFAHTDIERA